MGKSSLFGRLQGKPFSADYRPTDTLQSAKVSWNYKASNDLVNLEVWDVVDAQSGRKPSAGALSLVSPSDSVDSGLDSGVYDEVDLDMVPVAGKVMSPSGKSTMGQLDTSNVDVLRGTHAVVLIFNPMKKWTWDYVKREIPKIPARIQVLIMANFKDVLEAPDVLTISSETVDAREVRDYIDLYPDEGRTLYFLESSMQNCFGLKGLKTFLNLPFLLLQREYLETQLRQNTTELLNAQMEYKITTEQDSYDNFVQQLALKASSSSSSSGRSSPASATPTQSNPVTPSSSSSSIPSPNIAKVTSSTSSSTTSPNVTTTAAKNQLEPQRNTTAKKDVGKQVEAQRKATQNSSSVMPAPKATEVPEEAEFFWKKFKKKKDKLVANDGGTAVEELRKLANAKKSSSVSSIDDFVPESDDSWLKDVDDTPVSTFDVKSAVKVTAVAKTATKPQLDSDDEDSPNPALANYDEELDEADRLMQQAIAKAKAEKETKAKLSAKPTSKPTAATKFSSNDDDDDEDDDNPMLAQYEDDLDSEDQQIKGKPAPRSAPVPLAKVDDAKKKSVVTSSRKDEDDSDDDDDGNPALAAYSEEIDLDDFKPSSPAVKPNTPSIAPLSASIAPLSASITTISPTPATAKVASAPSQKSQLSPKPVEISQNSAKVSLPSQGQSTRPPPQSVAVKKSARPIVYSNSDEDNDLVAKNGSDTDEDSDEDFAGFVPKKAAAVVPSSSSSAPADMSAIPDFNPLDADTEADADAFWARARQPAPRKPTAASTSSAASTASNNASTKSNSNATSMVAPATDPFAFSHSNAASTLPPLSLSSNGSSAHERKDKDKHHKHKDKHHKHKDKSGIHSSSGTTAPSPSPMQSQQQPPQQSRSEWDFATSTSQQARQLPPPHQSTSPAPAPSPKKSIFYL